MAKSRNRLFAKTMRSNPTDAERRLWSHIRARRLGNYKFKRQVPIANFIADFVCEQAKLIIELDGFQHHEMREADAQRTKILGGHGYHVIRYWNGEIMVELDAVLEDILCHLANAKNQTAF